MECLSNSKDSNMNVRHLKYFILTVLLSVIMLACKSPMDVPANREVDSDKPDDNSGNAPKITLSPFIEIEFLISVRFYQWKFLLERQNLS